MRKKWIYCLLLVMCLAVAGCQSSGTSDTKSTEAANLPISGAETEAVNDAAESSDIVDDTSDTEGEESTEYRDEPFTLDEIPEYSGASYVKVNNNEPFFSEDDMITNAFENYSDLDPLGRCGVAYANIGRELMPTEERGAIGSVKPSGWQTVKYDCVDGKYLYNRCHLIGYQLSGENANEKNLITGTRYLNVDGMLPFENMVADYVKETNNHVLYRVTPMYAGEDLVASGVLIEGKSVEDDGEGICFNVFCYNVQPGVTIDYATGKSVLSDGSSSTEAKEESVDPGSSSGAEEGTYVLNTNTKKFHLPTCKSVEDMKDKNKSEFTGDRQELIDQGYEPCGNCHP